MINQTNNINKNLLNYFQKNNFTISNINQEKESQEYNASKFILTNTKTNQSKKIIFRTGKQTPTKPGYFVTIWKRENNITIPFDTSDNFDEIIILCENGFFQFSKQTLLENKLITDKSKNIIKGKNGFRLYTPNLENLNQTAKKTQNWQKNYFMPL